MHVPGARPRTMDALRDFGRDAQVATVPNVPVRLHHAWRPRLSNDRPASPQCTAAITSDRKRGKTQSANRPGRSMWKIPSSPSTAPNLSASSSTPASDEARRKASRDGKAIYPDPSSTPAK